MFALRMSSFIVFPRICHQFRKQTLERTGDQRILHSATLLIAGVLRAKNHDMIVRNAPYSGRLRGDFDDHGFFDVLLGASRPAFFFSLFFFLFFAIRPRNAAAV